MEKRCDWVPENVPIYVDYHDKEWGVPVHDDRKLFEFLILDAFQAGLSWLTILRKRDHFRKVFDNFDAGKIAGYGNEKVKQLLQDPGIIRNRLKVGAAIKNARAFLQAQQEFGSFDRYIWGFVGGKTIQNRWHVISEIPTKSKESDTMSEDMKKRGFSFVGSTICYAFMQAAGLVNDHTVDCFRYEEFG
ncbi:MAG TPA: DNA-3-methyladenine glycosylase I [Bacteroidetes bacterium]|nr:DNA-3-methyladenine glycosylase I [Bacteroidota bacterium]